MSAKMPVTHSTEADIVAAFTVVMYMLGARGRSALRSSLLAAADSEDARNCLTAMNDVERVMDWKAKQ